MPADVKSGVPQGSVLGPLLFLVLIGDIDREVATAIVSSFADDTRAANDISTNADVCDLQVDLDAIYIIGQMETIWNSTTQSLIV